MPILIGVVSLATAYRGWLIYKQLEHTLPRLANQLKKQFAK